MRLLPDLSPYGYQLQRELGANRAGGRVTYLATHLTSERSVVIKQFQFARSAGNWTDYDAFNQEIQVLKDLKHPGIPEYLGSFFSDEEGFFMVQEYKEAQSLAETRSFSPDEIRHITISILETLVYLQNRIPALIHRDIKPANILVSEDLKVYLVDFGFARFGDGEVGLSSVVKGTLGFMPPEQLFNRQLTEASDLYGLGMTLMCLLTNTPANEIGNLVDISYRVDLSNLKTKISPFWMKWLEKMTEPRVSERFPCAKDALAALPKYSLRQPELQCSDVSIDLSSQEKGEVLSHTIQLKNIIPETVLEGSWQVLNHPSDPQTSDKSHSWICFSPQEFKGNQVSTQIKVHTRPLMSGQCYQRQLILQTNAYPSVYSFSLRVETAPLAIRTVLFPYRAAIGLFVSCCLMSLVVSTIVLASSALSNSGHTLILSALFGGIVGLKLAAWILLESHLRFGSKAIATLGFIALALLIILSIPSGVELGIEPIGGVSIAVAMSIGIFLGTLTGVVTGITINTLWKRGFNPSFSVSIPTSLMILSLLLGFSAGFQFFNFWFFCGIVICALITVSLMLHRYIHHFQMIAHHRHLERHLIKP